MNNTIKLSEIPNFQNDIWSSTEQAVAERILFKLYNKKRMCKYRYGDKLIKIDITKEDIEKINYCQICGSIKDVTLEENCPKCGRDLVMIGYKLKERDYDMYSDEVNEGLLKYRKDRS